MQVRFKKLNPAAVIPQYAKPGDAGLDLTAQTFEHILTHTNGGDVHFLQYGTGLAVEIPEGFVGLVFPRSSISDMGVLLSNSVGVIDSGYRGEIKARFKYTGRPSERVYQPGDRIAQLLILPYPKISPVEAVELTSTARGVGGFGSSNTSEKLPDGFEAFDYSKNRVDASGKYDLITTDGNHHQAAKPCTLGFLSEGLKYDIVRYSQVSAIKLISI